MAIVASFCTTLFGATLALAGPESILTDLRGATAELSLALESQLSQVALEHADATATRVQRAIDETAAAQMSQDEGMTYDVDGTEIILDTLDTVSPAPPVACALVQIRMMDARVEIGLLTSIIHQLMGLIDQGTIPDSVMAMILSQVKSLSKRIEETYPVAWDEKSLVITRHWEKTVPSANLDDEHCNEINLTHLPISLQSWTAMKPISVLWQGLEWSQENLPEAFTFAAGPETVDLIEKASVTTYCLEPRQLQMTALLIASPSSSPLAPTPPGTKFVFRSRKRGN